MSDALKAAGEQLMAAGQMFETTEIDVRGAPVRVWRNAPADLGQLWAATAGHAEKDYLVYNDERWTYAEAHEAVSRIANWLHLQGVREHDRVAIAMRNYPEWMLSYWAITSMGAVVVGMNAWWVAGEMAYALNDSAAKVIIGDAERMQRLAEIRDQFPELRAAAVRCGDAAPSWATPWSEVLASAPEMPAADIDPDDDACVFYTSGTTGQPKGAQLTHRGCCNNVMSMLYVNLTQGGLVQKAQAESAATSQAAGAQELPPAQLLGTPLFHVTANNCAAQPVTLAGGKLVFMYKWDAEEALRLIEREQIRAISSVPAMTRELVLHPSFKDYDTSTVIGFGGGGAAVQPDLIGKIENLGRVANQGYGMTETCGIIAASMGHFLADKPTSCGPLLPIYDVEIRDAEGIALPTGEVGQVCIRGSQLIKGYLNRAEATAETIIDGWLHTGDIGYLDSDGFLYLVDRAKDMVLRGGENVYCSEVENVLFRHEAVQEAAVFSVPDERLGEEVGAAVYPRPGATLSPEALREFAREHMAAFKIPRYIWILDAPLPRNASGKFLKKALQSELDTAQAG
ncbi:acyl--CoA ligase [Pseudohalioglobus sediminis]|uniref:Acyl--CoA ligase n=1 Tax=Pseudohalioglobus sediminis TaxID=2606449 RepID=A0A5B0X6E1_9GAMM|nr:class I adenylate-forming enzyme family protein [Pseudohalioglobus sediminis]KAA1194245.1 acyl--CoA ligase [Pseudohalioglobus sediminis]